MAIVTGTNQPMNMADLANFGALLFSAGDGPTSSTSFSTINTETSGRWNFAGTGFGSYSGGIPTVGTITAITYFESGNEVLSVSGLSLTIATFFQFIATENLPGLLGFIYAGADVINGSSASDPLLDGYGGNDTIFGGDGDDYIRATSGSDTIDGGADNDFAQIGISSQPGAAGLVISTAALASQEGQILPGGGVVRNVEAFSLSTGINNDTLVITGDYSVSHIQARWNAGGGTDRLQADLTASQSPVEFIYNTQIGAVMNFRGLGLTGVDEFHITGGSASDYFIGGAGNDMFAGGAGNDRLDGRGGLNILFGGEGDDEIVTYTPGDQVDGGVGEDTMRINRQSATAALTISDRKMSGAEWTDLGDGTQVRGIEHLFETYTGSGNDTLELSSLLQNQSFYAGAGTDRLILDMSGSDTEIRLRYRDVGWYEDRLWTAGFQQQVYWTSVEAFTVTGGAAGDYLYGATGDDVLSGGGGVDRLWGDDGADWLEGGAGPDILDGGLGNDFATYAISGASVTVTLGAFATGGDAEGDSIINVEGVVGSRFSDHIIGSAGANTLLGGAGDDVLSGLQGDDWLDGGEGDDRLVAGDGGANTLLGGGGFDFLSFEGQSVGVHADLSAGAYSYAGGYDGLSSIEGVIGGAGADTLLGDAGANVLRGGNAGDALIGRDGDDTLAGEGGDDWMVGDAGNDLLEGGDGVNVLIGGEGTDLASYASQSGSLWIDMAAGVYSAAGVWDVFFQSIEGVLGGSGDDSIFGNGADNTLRGGAGNDALIGNAGNDRLEGGLGQDWIVGGDGNDRLIGGNNDVDVLTGGAGSDVFDLGANGGWDVAFDFNAVEDRFSLGGLSWLGFLSVDADGDGQSDDTLLGYAGGNFVALNASGLTLQQWNALVDAPAGAGDGEAMLAAKGVNSPAFAPELAAPLPEDSSGWGMVG